MPLFNTFLTGQIITSVTTTDATVTTIATIPIPSSTTLLIQALVTGRRTGGSAGATDDAATYEFSASYKNLGGVATELGESNIFSAEDQPTWNCTLSPSGSNALLQVTGAINNTINWSVSYTVTQIS
jgi:hypothetical protein